MVTLKIDDSTSEGRNLLEYVKTLKFVSVGSGESEIQRVLEDGGCTAEVFFDELRERVNKRFDGKKRSNVSKGAQPNRGLGELSR